MTSPNTLNNPNNGNNLPPSPNPNTHRDQDTAADIVDTLRALHGLAETDAQRAELFDPSGFDGATELLEIADEVRTGRVLNSDGTAFVDFMAIQARELETLNKLDFTALEAPITTSNGGTITGDEAVKTNLSNTIGTIMRKKNQTQDPAEKARLQEQYGSIFMYQFNRAIASDAIAGDSDKGRAFMKAYNDLQAATTPAETTAAQTALDSARAEMDDLGSKLSVQADAYDALLEHGPNTFKAVVDPNAPVEPLDPRLDYVAVNPRQQSLANPGTPGTPPPPAGGGPAAGGSPPSPPPPPQTPGIRGLSPEQFNNVFDDARNELAEIKSQTIRNNKHVRRALGALSRTWVQGGYRWITGGKEIRTQQDHDQIEADYNTLVRTHVTIKHGRDIANPNISDAEKQSIVAQAIILEQKELRKKTNQEMDDKFVKKAGGWMLKHKVVTVAGLTILSPLTGGASAMFGASLGFGLLAGAKIDDRSRGLRETEKYLKHSKLIEAAGPGNNWIRMQEYAMDQMGGQITREKWKRAGAVAVMGGIAVGATVELPSTAGIDNFIYNHQGFFRTFLAGSGAIALMKKPKSSGGH